MEVFFAKSEVIILSWRSYHGICQFGVQKNRLYNKVSYVKETGVKKVEEFENDQIEILRLRAGFEKIETIFLHHEYILLRFPATQTKCCDPLKKYKTKSWKRNPFGNNTLCL